MDVDGNAALIALGCYAIYLEAFAANDGFARAGLNLNSGLTVWDIEVYLEFRPDPQAHAAGYSEAALKERWTDRRPFDNTPCPPELRRQIDAVLTRYKGTDGIFISSDREALIAPLQKLEAVRWKSRAFRDALFEEIDFSNGGEADADRKIPVSQLGASFFDILILRLMRRFPILRRMLDCGGAEMIASKTVGSLFRHSSEVVFLQARTASEASVFDLGRCFQELWLVINAYGYSFQPVGLPLLAFSYWQGDKYEIGRLPRHAAAVREASESLQARFGLDLKKLVLGFRFGPTKFPQEASLRQSPRAEPALTVNRTD